MRWSFPGNVRELENLIERAIIFADSPTIAAADIDLPVIPGDLPEQVERGEGQPKTIRDVERELIEEALLRWEGNRTRAAEELGITRRTLFNKIKEYGLE
jgi:two-component system response regulator AtoC